MKQICIIGPSGTGKTDLANYIASRYRIQFVSSSSREISKEYEVDSHKELIALCVNEPEKALALYRSLLIQRSTLVNSSKSFVTDRGLPDLLVYSLIQLVPHIPDDDANKLVVDISNTISSKDTIYIFLPYTSGQTIEDNKFRVTNHLYQKAVSECFELINKVYLQNNRLIVMDDWNWESRVEIVDNMFNEHIKIEPVKYFKKLWIRLNQ